ncbi:MAG: type VI secretion system tip protein VgrG [Rhodobacteraceae bacterium]|nr:type VI secretion system tip protein VgrG [Paracoccaceae bacterium]
MPDNRVDFKGRQVWLEGSYASSPVNLKNARVVEGLSKLTETTIEFVSSDDTLDLQDILGSTMTLVQLDPDDRERYFTGICTMVEFVGYYQGLSHFVAETRPWLWFLTRTHENRIFQEKSVLDIIQEVLQKYGFWSDVEKKTTGTYKKRTYCVQYHETDFAFLSRLMEEEGIYYFFIQDGKRLKMVLADSISAHKPVPGGPEFEFHLKEAQYRRRNDHIFDWNESTRVTGGKVTLEEYDFEQPTADMTVAKKIEKGDHNHKKYEHYRYPGHTRIPGSGEEFTRIRMEAEAVRHKLSRGAGNVRTLGVGQILRLKGHPRDKNNIEYLVTHATHHLQIETDYEDAETKKPLFDSTIPVDEDNQDTYRIIFDVIPKSEPFRAPHTTPWPRIAGLQTAVVTGPKGEEIYTDKYGRIKVQFFWDRHGKEDENTTCWVRCVMPWTGKAWGMVSIPRIGNEVVIQFEEADPDRPICTGMIYNADNMPPYALPENMTQTGIKTRSSKKGGTNNFNELMFEDRKDEELVRFQAERDFKQIVKNNAEISIGVETQEAGDLTQTIFHTKTETIQTGDHIFTVETGNQEIFVNNNHKERIEGEADQSVVLDTTMTVEQGKYTQTIEMGNVTREVSMGNEDHTLKMGDYTLTTSLGSVTVTAMKEIKLVVGANSITIDQSGIKLNGIMVNVKGIATVDVGSPMTTVSGSGMLTLDGGITMIN